MKRKTQFYRQLDIFGNEVLMDTAGNIYPKVEYRVEMRVGKSRMMYVDYITAETQDDLYDQINVLAQKHDEEELSDNAEITEIQIYKDNKLIKSFGRTK